MGARGPKGELAQVKKLKGNPGKRPISEPGVNAKGDPFIAEHLPDDAKACIEVIRQSMPPGVYARADSFHLAAFARAWALHKEASEKVDVEGPVAKGSQGQPVVSPWVSILNEQARLMASLGDRLGLDPKSRAALKLPDEKPKSRFEGLMGGGAGNA
jgi:P27 family predicted phage terminase small subunit